MCVYPFAVHVRVPHYGEILTLPVFSGFKFSQLEMSKFQTNTKPSILASKPIYCLFSFIHLEVVLAVLISTFKFELGEKPIKWNLAGVVYPTVAGSSSPSLPLKVRLAKA